MAIALVRTVSEGDYYHDGFHLWQVREVNSATQLAQIETAWTHRSGEPVAIRELPTEELEGSMEFLRNGALST